MSHGLREVQVLEEGLHHGTAGASPPQRKVAGRGVPVRQACVSRRLLTQGVFSPISALPFPEKKSVSKLVPETPDLPAFPSLWHRPEKPRPERYETTKVRAS